MAVRFRPRDEAVTSPLGIALVIGISILLAVGLALMARVFTERNEETPPVAFSLDEAGDTIRVTRVDDDLLRSDFEIRLDVAGDFAIDEAIPPGDDAFAPGVYVTLGGPEALSEGLTIYVCAEPASADVHVEIRHLSSNALLFSREFRSLNDCPA